jgi:hypothetical protein
MNNSIQHSTVNDYESNLYATALGITDLCRPAGCDEYGVEA